MLQCESDAQQNQSHFDNKKFSAEKKSKYDGRHKR